VMHFRSDVFHSGEKLSTSVDLAFAISDRRLAESRLSVAVRSLRVESRDTCDELGPPG
jgi:hypothetical protein